MDIARGLLMVLLFLSSIFLILLVLIQRGRGGGLAGAFGGMGGQSAFGTKAGDLFTRVTIVTAAVWILLCAASVKIFSSGDDRLGSALGASQSESSSDKGEGSRSGDADKAETSQGAAPSDSDNSSLPPADGLPATNLPIPGLPIPGLPGAADSKPAADEK